MKEENKEPQVEIKKDVKKEHHDFKKEDKHLEKELHNALETNKKLTENLKDANDRVIRLSAEIQNIGKRHNEEISDMAKYEGIDLIKKLLPIVDNFERSKIFLNDSAMTCDGKRDGVGEERKRAKPGWKLLSNDFIDKV